MALLEVSKLEAFYGQTQVLRGLDFGLEEGGITTILGANGAGKTTTLRALCGMVRTRGEISFGGTKISGGATESIVRHGIAHVPEGRGTFVRLSTEENLRLGAYTRKDPQAVAEDLERVFQYFPRLKERRHQQAGTLSGGEQQMLAVGRALMMHPRLMLLDEPSFGLAPNLTEELFDILGSINKERKVSMLVVEQNASLALAIADHAYLLETGRIVISGTAKEIEQDETVRKAYLGY
jgi:branched-chain amino acid transport system ATP-binding protein